MTRLLLFSLALQGAVLSAQCANVWESMGVPPGLGGAVSAVTAWDPDGAGPAPMRLVVAGDFSLAGAVRANRIAAWDSAAGAWSPLGTGVNGAVNALAVLANGDLVAGGAFTTAGGVSANRVARWDGTAWSPLGAGVNGEVYALIVLPDGDLVAGGRFTHAGGLPANHIARWDGAAWTAFGSGVADTVVGLVFAPRGGLFVGGSFPAAGGLASSNLARLATTCPPDVQQLGVGCPSSGGSNTLTAAQPWAGGSWRWQVAGMPANALVLVALGFGTTSQPLAAYVPSPPGCVLHVQPDVGFALGPVAGALDHSAQLPDTVALAGVGFHLQVLPLDLTGPLQVTATNAVTVTVGVF